MTNASFDVAITDDNIVEVGEEDFELAINMSSLPSDVTVGIPGQVTVTIVDDDGKYADKLARQFANFIRFLIHNKL